MGVRGGGDLALRKEAKDEIERRENDVIFYTTSDGPFLTRDHSGR